MRKTFFVIPIFVIGIIFGVSESFAEETSNMVLGVDEFDILLFAPELSEDYKEVTFTLNPGENYRLDHETSIFVKQVHRLGSTEKVPYHGGSFDGGLPYVTIDGNYLEIVNYVEIINAPYKYSIKINDCLLSGRSHEDTYWKAIDSCEITVSRESSSDIITSTPLYYFEKRIDTKSWRNAGIFEINNIDNNFVKLRFLNQQPHFTDEDPFFNFAKSFDADFDIITNYGVKNIKVKNLWEENSVEIGPYKITYSILDIAGGNMRYIAIARYVFDINFQVEIISNPKDFPMKILQYNSAITQKPPLPNNSNHPQQAEFVNTKNIPHYLEYPNYEFIGKGIRDKYQFGIKIQPNEKLEKESHCDPDEYATSARVTAQGDNIIQEKEFELFNYDPENLRGESWKGNTSLRVFMKNEGDVYGTFFTAIQCKKINKETVHAQIELGVPESKLSCWDNFVLIQNTDKDKFACVSPENLNQIIQRGWGEPVQLVSENEIKDRYLSNKPIIYLQGELVYEENPQWSGSHYKIIPEYIFGIPWRGIYENGIAVNQEGLSSDYVDGMVKIKGIFLSDFSDHDYLFNSCYQCSESGPGIIVKEISRVGNS